MKGPKKATECEMLGTTSWIKLLKQTSQSGAWMCHVYGSYISRQSFCCCCCCLFFVGVVVFKRITSTFRFTSTEARWLIRDGDGGWGGVGGGGRGRKSEGSTADTARNRPERPWTAARTMEVHCAVAVSTAMLGQSHKDNVRCTAVQEQLEAKEVQLSQPSSTSYS